MQQVVYFSSNKLQTCTIIGCVRIEGIVAELVVDGSERAVVDGSAGTKAPDKGFQSITGNEMSCIVSIGKFPMNQANQQLMTSAAANNKTTT